MGCIFRSVIRKLIRNQQFKFKEEFTMQNVENKVVIITGASSGLGEATAKVLSGNGAKFVLSARREDRLTKLAG